MTQVQELQWNSSEQVGARLLEVVLLALVTRSLEVLFILGKLCLHLYASQTGADITLVHSSPFVEFTTPHLHFELKASTGTFEHEVLMLEADDLQGCKGVPGVRENALPKQRHEAKIK